MKHPQNFYRHGSNLLFSTFSRIEVGSGSRTQPSEREQEVLEAEACAYEVAPAGCTCPNNGAADCPWCEAKAIAESHIHYKECTHCGHDLCKHGYCTWRGCGDACLPCVDRIQKEKEAAAEVEYQRDVVGILMGFDTEVGHA